MNLINKWFLKRRFKYSTNIFYPRLFLIAVPIISGFIYALLYSVNVPYWDQWYIDVQIAIKYFTGTLTPNDFLTLHTDISAEYDFHLLVVLASMLAIFFIGAQFIVYKYDLAIVRIFGEKIPAIQSSIAC
jgi:hypothetical protein